MWDTFNAMRASGGVQRKTKPRRAVSRSEAYGKIRWLLASVRHNTLAGGHVEAVHEQTGELHRVRFDDGDRYKAARQLARLVGIDTPSE